MPAKGVNAPSTHEPLLSGPDRRYDLQTMKQRMLVIAVVVFALGAALHAAGPEEDYVRIYNQIQDADRLAQNQRLDQARTTYLEAQTRLGDLSRQYPDWNPNIIRFRLGYISRKLAALPTSQPGAAPVAPAPAVDTLAPTGDPGRQVEELQGRVRQLEREKSDLSARLREALAARPASVDPQELAVAEARVLAQQKEIELLRINLDKLKSDAARGPDAAGDPTRQALADAQRQVAQQAEQINTLTLERTALQQRLLSLVTVAAESSAPGQTEPAAVAAAPNEIEALKRQMQSLHQQLKDEQARNQLLVAEQQLIEQRLKETPSRAGDGELARRVQNLEQELESARQSSLTDVATISALRTALASANQEVNTLQGQVRSLQPQSPQARLEAMLNPATATVPVPSTAAAAAPNPGQPATEDLAELKARLAMLEARRVPYSPEELALFKVPEVSASTNATARVTSNLSRDTAMLITEAEKDLRAGRFAEAERKYQQALASDQNNVVILSSLAATQAEQGNLAQAEQTLGLALARDPNDAFSLFVLGRVRLEQGRADEAMTALSRSAYLDGSRSETFNLLGFALSQLGLREPAETALRRAVQIAPNNANAHHNLAVAYATQDPPSLGLARWHYEKAIAGGHRPDPEIEARLKAASNP
jgi:tetratricopeptide (TPR) repeat protein